MTCLGGCVHRHLRSGCSSQSVQAHEPVKEKWLQMENTQMDVSALKNLFCDAVAYFWDNTYVLLRS